MSGPVAEVIGEKQGYFIPILQGVLPINPAQIPAEIMAGLTLAALAIPEEKGYTKISGTPVITDSIDIVVLSTHPESVLNHRALLSRTLFQVVKCAEKEQSGNSDDLKASQLDNQLPWLRIFY